MTTNNVCIRCLRIFTGDAKRVQCDACQEISDKALDEMVANAKELKLYDWQGEE